MVRYVPIAKNDAELRTRLEELGSAREKLNPYAREICTPA